MEIRRARESELQAALDLREDVFVCEQGVSVEGDRDGRDREAVHLVAVTEDGAVVGTCRMLISGGVARFGRLAVARSHRGRGLGARLLEAAEREARSEGAHTMALHAQTTALSLYERAGYEPVGERFEEEGIEHLAMEKDLPTPTPPGA